MVFLCNGGTVSVTYGMMWCDNIIVWYTRRMRSTTFAVSWWPLCWQCMRCITTAWLEWPEISCTLNETVSTSHSMPFSVIRTTASATDSTSCFTGTTTQKWVCVNNCFIIIIIIKCSIAQWSGHCIRDGWEVVNSTSGWFATKYQLVVLTCL